MAGDAPWSKVDEVAGVAGGEGGGSGGSGGSGGAVSRPSSSIVKGSEPPAAGKAAGAVDVRAGGASIVSISNAAAADAFDPSAA